MRKSSEIVCVSVVTHGGHKFAFISEGLFDGDGCNIKWTAGGGILKSLLICLVFTFKGSQGSHAEGMPLEDEGGKELVLFLGGRVYWSDVE